MKQKDIFIVSQDGLNPQANQIAVEAIKELMACFPQYKNDYPITNLGAWKDTGYIYPENGKLYLAQYKSTRWHIENAKRDAILDGRPNQLNASTLFQTMQTDPTNKEIPQFTILLTKDDLYPNQEMNYCFGLGDEGIGCVVSARRFSDDSGNIIDCENFKTVLMHEFGHVIGLTYEGRENSADIYGTHCTDEDGLCIMQQRVDGDFSDITRARLACKREGLSPICPDCVKAGNRFFAKERQQNNVNKIVNQTLRDIGIRR